MSTELSLAILGATGPVGTHVARSALEKGYSVVAASRSAARLTGLQQVLDRPVAMVQTDITSGGDSLSKIADQCEVVIVSAGGDPSALAVQVDIARAVVASRPRRVLYVSSCWSFAPLQNQVLDEVHPRVGAGIGRFRREAEDIFLSYGAVVLHLPDFFGPGVRTSPLQRAVQLAVSRQVVPLLADGATVREHAYISDIGRLVVRSAEELPGGRNFILPGSGPISFQEIVNVLEKVLGRKVRTRALGHLPIPLLRMVDDWARHLGDALPEYRKSIEYNASLMESYLGASRPTSYQYGIAETIAWMTGSSRDQPG